MATGTPHLTEREQPPVPPVLPLQNRDHLTREEFERRYEAMPNVKAELIEGVVYLASPVNQENHGKHHGWLSGWVCLYRAGTPGIELGLESSLILGDKNEPQPDALLYVLPSHGGQTRLSADGYFTAAPEWAGEVSASSASYDLHVKLHVYRRHGVKEYLVWRVLDRAIAWFVLHGEVYDRLPLSVDGYYRSEVFPGLWLDPQAMLTGDIATVLQVLQRGLASPEHQRFVDHLARQAARP